jgi:TonB family protein
VRISRFVAGLLLAVVIARPAAAQPNALNAARDLYAAARYDEALAMLNGLPPGNAPVIVDVTTVQQYRSLCLLALGRGAEAEEAIGAVVTANPSYQPSEAEASPRVRSAFSEVRQRLLPRIAQTRYSEGKDAYDQKRFADAESQLREVLTLIDDPDMLGRLADLRVLVSGFIDLTVAALTPSPPPPPPVVELRRTPEPTAPATEPVAAPERIFGGDDPGVTAPVVIRQQLPRLSPQIGTAARSRGLLEVVIDEQGHVVSAAVRMTVHPTFDQALLAATRDWSYMPATRGGQPVKFRKMIQVVTR